MATLAALIAGFAAGAAVHWLGEPGLLAAVDLLEPIGKLWAGALRTLALPLVVTVLIASIAGFGNGRIVGRMGAVSMAVFVSLLIFGGLVTVVVTPAVLRMLPLETLVLPAPDAAAAAAAPGGGAAPGTIGQWLKGLLALDLVGAIARGELLAILGLGAAFALALTRIPEGSRRLVVGPLDAFVQAMLVVLSWLLYVAPPAVFALTFSMAAKQGPGAAGMLGATVGIMTGVLLLLTGAMYPAAAIIGRVPVARFARGVAPAQIVALSTRSSIASLPSLLAGGSRIGLPAPVGGFALPLSVALFKANKTVTGPIKLFVLAHMYGIELAPGVIATYLITSVLLSFATPGIPATGAMPTLPALLAAGMPLEGIIIINTIDSLPDIFKTLYNVTADMAAATIVGRLTGYARDEAPHGVAVAASAPTP